MNEQRARDFQTQLLTMGYDPGPIDGRPGQRTRSAAGQLQQDLRVRIEADLLSPEFAELVQQLARGGWRRPVSLPSPPTETVGYRDLLLRLGGEERDANRQLQRHLRMLGYLKRGIDGVFGKDTENAVRALQYDLLHNDGSDSQGGLPAPVRVMDYNQGHVEAISGVVDSGTADCIERMFNDPRFPRLPRHEDPRRANREIRESIRRMTSDRVPMPFLQAILQQESGIRHYEVPSAKDQDDFIVVGLDANDQAHPYRITSRGYGAGQYTLFHHPPRYEEIERFMLTVEGNLLTAIDELRTKFDRFVNGSTSQTTADDRVAEHGRRELRICTYAPEDPRYLKDCTNCAQRAGTETIRANETPYYRGSREVFRLTQYHRTSPLTEVPIRRRIPCDWPYAVRRYNGSGVNSYWYQAKVLRVLRTQNS